MSCVITISRDGLFSLTVATMQMHLHSCQHTPVQALQYRPESRSPRTLQMPELQQPADLHAYPQAPTFGLTAAATAAVPFWAPVCMKDRMPDTRLFPIWARPPPPACGGAAAGP